MHIPLPEFMKPLYRIEGGLPEEAMAAAIERASESVPYLLQSIEETIADPDSANRDDRYSLPLHALFILGYLKEPKAREPILTLARHPKVDVALGDAITTGLGEILANLFLDEPNKLYPLVEDSEADEYARAAGLQALGVLHQAGYISRETLSNYISQLYATKLERRKSYVWDAAVSISADFAMSGHREAIRKAYADGLAEEAIDLLEDVEKALEGDRPFVRLEVDYQCLRHPIDELENWYCFKKGWDPESEYTDSADSLEEEESPMWDHGDAMLEPMPTGFFGSDSFPSSSSTYHRPTPKVGRNEPCLCGSGKKYKKCCGA